MPINSSVTTSILVLIIALHLSPDPAAGTWAGVQEGSSSSDIAYGVAVDSSSNVYVAGYTGGSLYGTNAGSNDLFVAKFNSAGTRQWGVQEGTSSNDYAYGVAVDSSLNVYVAGFTTGSLYGTNAGSNDLFVAKFNSAGTRQWGVQEGTSSNDYARGVAVDSSLNVYVAGYTYGSLYGTNAGISDLFVAKFNSAGTRQWGVQEGNGLEQYANGVAVDSSSNVYVAGTAFGYLYRTTSGYNFFVAKFNSAGTRQWGVQEGLGGTTSGEGVAVDLSSNVYIVGYTSESLYSTHAGSNDLFVAKFNSAGTRQWGVQEGTSLSDWAYGVAVDSSSNVYVAGYTYGSLYGTHAGFQDLFVAMYDSAGTRLSNFQKGTSSNDYARGVAVDSSSNVYVAGLTEGSLYDTNPGNHDLIVSHLGWCPGGQVVSSGSCVSCTAGSYAAKGYLSCRTCQAGTISAAGGAAACTQCGTSSIAASTGLTSCSACTTPGIRANDARTACDTACDVGFYCDGASLAMTACGAGTFTTTTGSTTEADCVECSYAPACPGTGYCATGYTGRLCSECSTGYYRLDEACVACPANTVIVYVIMGIIVFALLVGIYVYAGREGKIVTASARLGILYGQLTSVVLLFDIKWPNITASVIPTLSVAFSVDFDVATSSPECDISGITWFHRWLMYMLLPVAIAAVFGVLSVIKAVISVSRHPEDRDWTGFYAMCVRLRLRGLASYGNALVMLYIMISVKIFNFFDCTKTSAGDYLLDASQNVDCFGRDWMDWLAPAIVFGMLYLVGIPAILSLWLCTRSRRRTGEMMRLELGWLYAAYSGRPRCGALERLCLRGGRPRGCVLKRLCPLRPALYWEVWMLGHRLILAFLVVMLSNYGGAQLGVAFVAGLIMLALVVWMRPYRCWDCPLYGDGECAGGHRLDRGMNGLLVRLYSLHTLFLGVSLVVTVWPDAPESVEIVLGLVTLAMIAAFPLYLLRFLYRSFTHPYRSHAASFRLAAVADVEKGVVVAASRGILVRYELLRATRPYTHVVEMEGAERMCMDVVNANAKTKVKTEAETKVKTDRALWVVTANAVIVLDPQTLEPVMPEFPRAPSMYGQQVVWMGVARLDDSVRVIMVTDSHPARVVVMDVIRGPKRPADEPPPEPRRYARLGSTDSLVEDWSGAVYEDGKYRVEWDTLELQEGWCAGGWLDAESNLVYLAVTSSGNTQVQVVRLAIGRNDFRMVSEWLAKPSRGPDTLEQKPANEKRKRTSRLGLSMFRRKSKSDVSVTQLEEEPEPSSDQWMCRNVPLRKGQSMSRASCITVAKTEDTILVYVGLVASDVTSQVVAISWESQSVKSIWTGSGHLTDLLYCPTRAAVLGCTDIGIRVMESDGSTNKPETIASSVGTSPIHTLLPLRNGVVAGIGASPRGHIEIVPAPGKKKNKTTPAPGKKKNKRVIFLDRDELSARDLAGLDPVDPFGWEDEARGRRCARVRTGGHAVAIAEDTDGGWALVADSNRNLWMFNVMGRCLDAVRLPHGIRCSRGHNVSVVDIVVLPVTHRRHAAVLMTDPKRKPDCIGVVIVAITDSPSLKLCWDKVRWHNIGDTYGAFTCSSASAWQPAVFVGTDRGAIASLNLVASPKDAAYTTVFHDPNHADPVRGLAVPVGSRQLFAVHDKRLLVLPDHLQILPGETFVATIEELLDRKAHRGRIALADEARATGRFLAVTTCPAYPQRPSALLEVCKGDHAEGWAVVVSMSGGIVRVDPAELVAARGMPFAEDPRPCFAYHADGHTLMTGPWQHATKGRVMTKIRSGSRVDMVELTRPYEGCMSFSIVTCKESGRLAFRLHESDRWQETTLKNSLKQLHRRWLKDRVWIVEILRRLKRWWFRAEVSEKGLLGYPYKKGSRCDRICPGGLWCPCETLERIKEHIEGYLDVWVFRRPPIRTVTVHKEEPPEILEMKSGENEPSSEESPGLLLDFDFVDIAREGALWREDVRYRADDISTGTASSLGGAVVVRKDKTRAMVRCIVPTAALARAIPGFVVASLSPVHTCICDKAGRWFLLEVPSSEEDEADDKAAEGKASDSSSKVGGSGHKLVDTKGGAQRRGLQGQDSDNNKNDGPPVSCEWTLRTEDGRAYYELEVVPLASDQYSTDLVPWTELLLGLRVHQTPGTIVSTRSKPHLVHWLYFTAGQHRDDGRGEHP